MTEDGKAKGSNRHMPHLDPPLGTADVAYGPGRYRSGIFCPANQVPHAAGIPECASDVQAVPSFAERVLRHDPQLRIGPSMPIILQIWASKHATFV